MKITITSSEKEGFRMDFEPGRIIYGHLFGLLTQAMEVARFDYNLLLQEGRSSSKTDSGEPKV